MPAAPSLRDVLRNLMQERQLPFNEFVGLALYHPEFGYYARARNPIGKGSDYVTAPSLSPVFSFAIARLVREFLRRNEGALCSIVDIGCGDGSLIRAIAEQVPEENARFFGVDRALRRAGVPPATAGHPARRHSAPGETPGASGRDARPPVEYLEVIDDVPRHDAQFVFSNELFDAFPFARLVQRDRLRELCVTDGLEWSERDASSEYVEYFRSHGVALKEGQFADVALEWGSFYEDVARFVERGLIVTIDYGYPANKLFHPRARRFGTAAAYAGHRVSRDLLANPGEQDLTAHINFTDLERAGQRHGATTLYFDRLAKFLLGLGITEHELFRPLGGEDTPHPAFGHPLPASGARGHHPSQADEGWALATELREAREEARRLVLPDGIGEEMRVLVQGKDVPPDGWSFQAPLFP